MPIHIILPNPNNLPRIDCFISIVSSFESLSSLASLRMNPFLEMTLLLVIANSFTKYGRAELNDKIKKNIVTGNDRNALNARKAKENSPKIP